MTLLVRLIGPSLIALGIAAGTMLWSPAPEAHAIGRVPPCQNETCAQAEEYALRAYNWDKEPQ